MCLDLVFRTLAFSLVLLGKKIIIKKVGWGEGWGGWGGGDVLEIK